jgi:RNA polymerase sigma-70 factor (ECF subfamily)
MTSRENAAEGLRLTEGVPATAVSKEEAALVARARRGDAPAFEDLYHRSRDKVYTLCLNLCGNHEDAQDLLQETFVHACRGLPKFAGRSAFSTWLYRIAINVVRGAARRRRQAPQPQLTPSVDTATVGRVRTTLARLRPAHRTVLALRYSQELSYNEIAECLQWSLSRVKVTIHRAKLAFKNAYSQVDGAEEIAP